MPELTVDEAPASAPEAPPQKPWWGRTWIWVAALLVVGGVAFVLLSGVAADASGACGGG